MNGGRTFVPPRPRPSSVPCAPTPPRPRRRSKREVRDCRLLAKLAVFVKALRWWPSAPELAATLQRDRVTVWRALARLRDDHLVRMERRGAWELTKDGWSALNRDPVPALIERKPRARKHRVEAVRRAVIQHRLAAHLLFAVPAARSIAQEDLPVVE